MDENLNQPQIPSAPEFPEPHSSTGHGAGKKLPKYLILVLVIAGVAVAGYFVVSKFNYFEEELPGQADKTANWKTYRNEEYGFEVKYPSFLSETEHSNNRLLVAPMTEQYEHNKEQYTLTLISLNIDGYEYNNAPAGIICKFDGKSGKWSATQDTNVNACPTAYTLRPGVTAYAVSIADGAGLLYGAIIPIWKRGIFIEVDFSVGICDVPGCTEKLFINDDPKALFNQILSTFKFTK